MIINQFSMQISHQLSSQVRATQIGNVIFLFMLYTACGVNILAKSKDPLVKVLVQDFHFPFSSPMQLLTAHGQLTAAARLLQPHSSLLTTYVSRHNYAAGFAGWDDWFSHPAACLEQTRCACCLVRRRERGEAVNTKGLRKTFRNQSRFVLHIS